MEELQLTRDLYREIVIWMRPKYSPNSIRQYSTSLKKIFKNYMVLNHSNLKKIMKLFKHQNQRAALTLINRYCYDNNIDFHITIPSIKKQANKLPEILSTSEIKKMIEITPYPYDLAIRCIFNMGAGLRISEVIKLSWQHIRWIDWLDNKDSYGIANIKSGKGMKDRVVNVPKKLMQDLYDYAIHKGHLNEYNAPKPGMIFNFGYEDNPEKLNKREKAMRELMSEDKELWKEKYVHSRYDWFRYNILKKYCEKALNKPIKIHQLRHCISGDTEILTLEGWKKHNKLKIGDEVFSYNLAKNSLEKDNVLDIYKYDYNGILERIENRYIDEFITPEHKVVLKEITNKKDDFVFNLKPYSKVNKKCQNISHKLSAKIDNKDNKLGIERAGILGWILSDGRICARKFPSIEISQSYTANKDKCEYIEELLIKGKVKYTKKKTENLASGFNQKPYTMIIFYILKGGDHSKRNKGKLHDWIYKYINKDRTPKLKEILSLSYEELKELYKCMMLGDGTKKNCNCREYTGQNEERINLIRILCVLLGNISSQGYKIQNNKKYSRIYIRENRDYCQISKHKNHFKKEHYEGVVWCPATKNQTFIAKRNDKIFITGNSRATYLYEIEKVPIEKIQLLLGHNSLNTTMLYTRINPKSVFEMLKETKEV